ncbi:hypothetical protein ON010_g493 [Phytophthora cinnamomi]|nr:hypothetical protein ON010_g493 [Phytophthora cinnamomi]
MSAPVIRMEVLRLLLTVAAVLDLEIHPMDVKTAFLNGLLEEEIYMAQPGGFQISGKKHLVCKQTPEDWVLKRTPNGVTCYITVYVDELLIISPTPVLVGELKSALKKRFSMTDLGEHKYATKVPDPFSDYIPYPIATPTERNAKLSVSSQSSGEAEKDARKNIPYRGAVGSIMYLMERTRSDMAFYMREVGQFLANPGREH